MTNDKNCTGFFFFFSFDSNSAICAPSHSRATTKNVRCALTSPAGVLGWMSSGGGQRHSHTVNRQEKNTTMLWGGFLEHYGLVSIWCRFMSVWFDWLITWSLIDSFEFTPIRLWSFNGTGRRRRTVRGHVTDREAVECGRQGSPGKKFAFPLKGR